MELFLRSRVTAPPVCMHFTSLENQIKRDNKVFPWLIFVCVFQSLFLGKGSSYSSWQKESQQTLLFVSRFSDHAHALKKQGINVLLKESHFHGTDMLFF